MTELTNQYIQIMFLLVGKKTQMLINKPVDSVCHYLLTWVAKLF